MTRSLPIPIVAILCILLAPSCGKKSNSHSQTCQIITVTEQAGTSTTTYNLTYDNQGRLSSEQVSASGNPWNLVFNWSGNTVIAALSYNTGSSKDSITLNSYGLMASDYYSDNLGHTAATIYTYSGSEVQMSVFIFGSTADTTTYTWTNGDLTGSSFRGVNSTYTYNSKASEAGDYWQIDQLVISGLDYIRTAHQVVSYQVGATILNFGYTYDSAGKIISLTRTQNTTISEKFGYQYMCN